MRILLPYSNAHGRKFDDPVITGGIEKFCHSIYETFDDVKVIEIEDVTNIKENVELIKKSALEYNADVVISNWTQASFCGMKIMDCPIPILYVCHGNHGMISTLNRFYKLKENKHSVFFVSEYQSLFYNQMAKRTKCEFIDIDGYINSGYVRGDKPKLVDWEYEICTIGRCDPSEKRPFLLKKLLKDTDIKTLVMTNRIEEGRPEYEYYQRNKDTSGTLWDLEYKDVMNNLSKSMTFFQTFWQESYGLTTLEALSRGVPVILNTRYDYHAAETIQSKYFWSFWKQNHCTKIPINDKDALVSAINSYRDIDRKEIQDMTWEKHSHQKWKTCFENAIDKTIENFKK